MSVRRVISNYDGIYFITLTCARWQKLFEIINGYDIVYTWFDYLKRKGHYITGYVIMPNFLLRRVSRLGDSVGITKQNRYLSQPLVRTI